MNSTNSSSNRRNSGMGVYVNIYMLYVISSLLLFFTNTPLFEFFGLSKEVKNANHYVGL